MGIYFHGKSSILGSIREKHNLSEKFVLYVGDVTWNKNLSRLIQAIKKINLMGDNSEKTIESYEKTQTY